MLDILDMIDYILYMFGGWLVSTTGEVHSSRANILTLSVSQVGVFLRVRHVFPILFGPHLCKYFLSQGAHE